MNYTQIENNVQKVIKEFNQFSFIYDLLLAYGFPKASIKRLQTGTLNMSGVSGEIAWKKKLFFKEVESEELYSVIDAIKSSNAATKHDPRFVIVTDYKRLLAIDSKTQDSLDIELLEFPKHFDFFLPWAGMEKAQLQMENPADVKAAEKMAKLYDEIKKDNPITTAEEVHNLNVFLSRLLFCFFAEDTGIFPVKGQFTNAIDSHTQADGSDLHTYLDNLFIVLNTELNSNFRRDLPVYLDVFPYVNGGLFGGLCDVPSFTRKSRQILVECGELDWSAINPDIFGSMIQAVVTPEHRGGMGMHYTSVPNIMKVIEPLFLNELHEEFEASKNEPRKLQALLQRIAKILIFDPACGSGNFLIIAYKELRLLEIKILQQLQLLQRAATGFEPHQLELIPKAQLTLAAQYQPSLFSIIELQHFYGIELDDFAHEIAILSLWLAQHQMNQKFKEVFGEANPTLPLQAGGNIIHGNATRLDWEIICPKNENDEIYILGNPPYLGQKKQNSEQKQDLYLLFNHLPNFKTLDYISCWFYKASNFINTNSCFAFVSTNSICQGSHVPLLWPYILQGNKNQVFFAVKDFKWSNNAKNKAGVTCSIVGVNSKKDCKKSIITGNSIFLVKNITPYLNSDRNIIVEKRAECISELPKMVSGNMALDDGHLLLEDFEKIKLINDYPDSEKFIRETTGGKEYIYDIKRWCLWIENKDLDEAIKIIPIKKRIDACYNFRINGGEVAKTLANRAHQFRYRHVPLKSQIIIPQTTSESREYIPFGFLNKDIIIQQSAQVLYDPEPYVLGILSSKIHLVWVKAVGGKHESRIRYSPSLCYNTFPFPSLSQQSKDELTKCTYRILEAREKHSELTLAQLYDPDQMPKDLREAHRLNDIAVDLCYRIKPFETDEERLEYLFKLYEQMIAEEKNKGTLFEGEEKPKKKPKKVKA